jgi:hypothetical protein
VNSLELKIPPVAVVLCTASLMWVVALFLRVGVVEVPAGLAVALRADRRPLVHWLEVALWVSRGRAASREASVNGG